MLNETGLLRTLLCYDWLKYDIIILDIEGEIDDDILYDLDNHIDRTFLRNSLLQKQLYYLLD